MDGSVGELEALKVRLEAAVRQGEESLASFRVHEQYHELEATANRLSQEFDIDGQPARSGSAAAWKLSSEPRRHAGAEC